MADLAVYEYINGRLLRENCVKNVPPQSRCPARLNRFHPTVARYGISIMREAHIAAKLAHALSERLRPSIPFVLALRHIATLAQYLKRDRQVTRKQIVMLVHFPNLIRRPTEKEQASTSPLQLLDDAMMADG